MEKKEYLITNSRFKLIVIILVIMWIGIMILLYLKANEVTKSPCEVCAKAQSSEVVCSITSTDGKIFSKVYYPNLTISDLIEGKS